MSNKTTAKSSKKDRPKSSEKPRKRRDGTPEKSAVSTASQEGLREEMVTRANIIWNDEIEALGIKEEDLQKLHEKSGVQSIKAPQPPKQVTVKKLSPLKEIVPKKAIIFAKPAPTETELQPADQIGRAGLQYDEDGDVIPHSILGHYEDFYREAIERGDILDLPKPKSVPPSPIPMQPRPLPTIQTTKHIDENNALRHWGNTMELRKKTQNAVAGKVDKNPDQLLMTGTDQYRAKQEQRHLIDRTIPLIDYGKGYRIYSEFWKQQKQFGDEELGLHETLTQTDKGFAPPIEQLGMSRTSQKEKGMKTSDPKSQWWEGDYLASRMTELAPYMREIRPHQPEFSGLEVIGSNKPDANVIVNTQIKSVTLAEKENVSPRPEDDPLSKYPDVKPEIIFGPSISFAGQPARWTGDSHSFRGNVGIEARVAFEVLAGNRVLSKLQIVNDGTTAIYYSWEARVAFEVLAGNRVLSKLQIVNDGTTAIYYSWEKVGKDNPFGVFHETIQRFYFNTSNGVLLPGESMKFPFVFKSSTGGVFMEQWRFITAPVVSGGADLIVTLRGISVMDDKFYNDRAQIEDMLHKRQTNRIVGDLLYDLISGIRTPPRSRSPIDAYITDEETFTRANHGACMEMDDEREEKREEFLHKLNDIVQKLSFPMFLPKQENLQRVGCQILREAIDQMVGQAFLIRNSLRLPSQQGESTEETGKKGDKRELAAKKSASKDLKKGDKGNIKGGKSAGKTGKPPSRTGTRGEVTLTTPEPEPVDIPASPDEKLDETDPYMAHKYYEKLYTQTYLILSESVGKMADAIEEIHRFEGYDKLQKHLQS